MLGYTLYVIYALAQAILIARYLLEIKPKDGPVFWVCVMALLAPVTTLAVAGFAFYAGVVWLVTYRSPKEKETEAK